MSLILCASSPNWSNAHAGELRAISERNSLYGSGQVSFCGSSTKRVIRSVEFFFFETRAEELELWLCEMLWGWHFFTISGNPREL